MLLLKMKCRKKLERRTLPIGLFSCFKFKFVCLVVIPPKQANNKFLFVIIHNVIYNVVGQITNPCFYLISELIWEMLVCSVMTWSRRVELVKGIFINEMYHMYLYVSLSLNGFGLAEFF